MKKSNLILLLSSLFAMGSCTENNVAPQNVRPDVYLAGYEFFPNSNFAVATYWKNGEAVHLTDGSQWSEAHSIVVSGNDVYVAGRNGDNTAYWKNGTPHDLGSYYYSNWDTSPVVSIAVSGNNVYVAGTVPMYKFKNWENRIAVYWKNGTQINLTPDAVSSEAFDIAVSGDDIYVAGSKFNGRYDAATYWKNGIEVMLTDGLTDTIPSLANALVVSGSDVYVSGKQVGFTKAKYWKNGVVTDLNNGTDASDIVVSGNDVYVSGYSSDGFYTTAIYWKNGAPVPLSSAPTSGSVSSIAVSGNDVYAAGNLFYSAPPGEAATYWKNGNPEMTIDSESGPYIKAIYLANK